MPCIMGAATLAQALGAVTAIVLIDGFPQHRYRSLDNRVLKRRLPNRTLPPISLVEPDALDRRGLVAPAAQALVEVVEVLVEVFRVLLRSNPVDSWRARLARPVRGLPQKGYVDQVCERRKDAGGIAGGLRCNPLELWCDGWCSHGLSRRAVQLNVMPGVAFPPVGPVGRGSPPSSVLCVAKTAILPVSGRFARRSLPDTVPASARSWYPLRAHARVEAPDHARAFGRPVPQSGNMVKEIGGSPTFPRSPSGCMPRSQTPVVSCPRAISHAGLLPSGACTPSAFLSVPP